MQQGSGSSNGSLEAAEASSPSLFLSADRHYSSLPHFISSSGEFVNVYPSAFSSKKSPPFSSSTQLRCSTSVPLTPSSTSCEEEVEDAVATEHRLYLAHLTLQYEEMLDSYELCLSQLEDAAAEAEVLRLENAKLRIANAELARRLSFLSTYDKRRLGGGGGGGGGGLMEASAGYPSNLLNELRRLHLTSESPTSESSTQTGAPDYHLEKRLPRKEPFPEHRSTLPKSISIRSRGYTKLATSNRNGRIPVSNPVLLRSQQVYVPVEEEGGGGNDREKEKEATKLEFEVYAQGMFKTELCNKWQETGSCPYGDHCQFAHGVAELRPVIRHPRYKTEICRMILAGGTCPYGHRCHFRHALSPQNYCLPSPTI